MNNDQILQSYDPKETAWSLYTGSLNNYPRPQGRLPMFQYGLKENAQKEMSQFYQNVLRKEN